MAHIPQPAQKGYFFEQGFVDIKNVIKETFAQVKESISDQKVKMELAGKFMKIFHISVIVSIWLFGGIFSFIISAVHIIINFIIMLFYYILFLIVLLIDRAYLAINKISVSCYVDKSKFLYPIYLCPKCGAEHSRLTPSVYGVLKRICNCGEVLPTSILNVKKKRKDLEAICPTCKANGIDTPLSERENRTLCIPVVGGPSVGKSAFITAYANLFLEDISINKGVTTEMYDATRAYDYKAMQTFYRTGRILKTAVETDLSKASGIAFSFFINHPSLVPERVLHIYDMAGESFIGQANEIQKQYDYCDGFIMIIDPFSIPNVMARYGSQLDAADRDGTSETSLEDTMDNFIQKLEQTTGLSRGKVLSTPLAIVISKTDQADLDLLIGEPAIERAMLNNPTVFTDKFDTMDYLCREFLRKMDMESILSHIQLNFKKSRFFAVSAIGHTVNRGRYNPRNISPVFDWIFGNGDKKLASLVSTTRFSNAKLPIESTIETINLEEELVNV